MKFRKKPVEIEAVQWTGNNVGEIRSFAEGVFVDWTPAKKTLSIPTLEGAHTASCGDWIIRGVKGEFYPCKPDIFEQTYERVEAKEGDDE